jgi:hypothetical protein
VARGEWLGAGGRWTVKCSGAAGLDCSSFLVPKLGLGTHSSKTPFRSKIATIFENLNRFGMTFQKVFCHSAKSQTPLAEYFSSCKTLNIDHLRPAKIVFCHSAKAQRKPKKKKW